MRQDRLNHAAKRRVSRRKEQALAREASDQCTSLPAGFRIEGNGTQLINCVAVENGGAGIVIGKGVNATAHGCLSARNGRAGVIIERGGHLESQVSVYRENGGPDVANHGRFDEIQNQFGP